MARQPNTGDPKDFAAYSLKSWKELDGYYSFWVRRWRRVLDFLRSQHWAPGLVKDEAAVSPDTKKMPTWRSYTYANHVLAVYNDFLNQWMQSQVRYTSVPTRPDPQQIAGAELADNILRYIWDRLEIEDKRQELGMWLVATGNAHLRIFWDQNTGNMAPLMAVVDGRPVPVNPETGQPDPTMQRPVLVDTGEIGVEVVPPMLVRWSRDRQSGVMVGGMYTYDDAVDTFGKDVAEGLKYTGGTSAIGLDLVYGNPASSSSVERALVVEHHLPRSRQYPGGLWWTSNEGKMVQPPQPLVSRIPPVISYRWVPTPDMKTFGMSPLYDITFSNRAYDEMLARSIEWSRRVVPKMLLKAGGGVAQGEFNEEPGQEVVTNVGAEPAWTSPPEPPNLFQNLRVEAREDLLFVAGYKTQRPKELPPGEATQRVRQPVRVTNTGEQVALAVINSETSWQRFAYVILDYVAKFYDEQRAIGLIGPDRTYQWREFKGSDLQNLEATIHVDKASLHTWNRQSAKDSLIALMNTAGAQTLLTGPDGQIDRDRVEAVVEVAGFERSLSTLDPDVLEARNENYLFQTLQEGMEPPKREPWQNDEVHLEEHGRILKSMAFKGWPQPAQEALMANYEEHQQVLSEQQQAGQQALVQQEQQMREIRATTETAQKVRTKLGEELVELLLGTVKGELEPEEKTEDKKES